jgi:hypothetical protein
VRGFVSLVLLSDKFEWIDRREVNGKRKGSWNGCIERLVDG